MTEFEETFIKTIDNYDQIPGVQNCFGKDIRALVNIFEEMGNPFLGNSTDLLVLDNKEIMPEIVVESVKNAHQIEQSQYDEYTT